MLVTLQWISVTPFAQKELLATAATSNRRFGLTALEFETKNQQTSTHTTQKAPDHHQDKVVDLSPAQCSNFEVFSATTASETART